MSASKKDPIKLELEDVTLTKRVTVEQDARSRIVLDGVSARIGAREVFGIIGPSGSGKTTLLRVMNGLDSPDEGIVRLDGVDTAEIDVVTLRRRVGMVFQVPALFSGSVRDNVTYALRLDGHDLPGAESRGLEYLAQVGLSEDFWGRDAGELSVGEQQRVAIARALAAGPEVLLMDEPTSGLDPGAAARILRLVGSLNADLGVTIVFVTHLMDQAREICQRALVLIEGRGVEEGRATELFESPTCELTRLFIDGRLDESSPEDRRAGRATRRSP